MRWFHTRSVRKFKATQLLWLLALLPVSCASPQITLAPVGPGPLRNGATTIAKGDLQVFTETQEYGDDLAVPFFAHTDYWIYSTGGKRLKRVWNHQDPQDEQPATVTLAAGQYLIKAEAELYGLVMVPVTIKPGETTRVILQPGWTPPNSYPSSELVRFPDGYFVGWNANR